MDELLTPPTAAELDRWQEACDKATPGPWESVIEQLRNRGSVVIARCCNQDVCTRQKPPYPKDYQDMEYDPWQDAAFIALAREALPRLIAAYRERCEWRPIETAPKDGTSVLLSREESAIEGFWRKDAGQWDSALGWLGTELVTHWMPLPPPPETT